MAKFETRVIAVETDVMAPDGSEVRLLVTAERGGMAYFRLAASAVSRAVRHRTIAEVWFFTGGEGEM